MRYFSSVTASTVDLPGASLNVVVLLRSWSRFLVEFLHGVVQMNSTLVLGFCFLMLVGVSSRGLSSGELDRERCGELIEVSSSVSSGLRRRGIL